MGPVFSEITTGPILLIGPQRVTDGRNRNKLIHPVGDEYDWT